MLLTKNSLIRNFIGLNIIGLVSVISAGCQKRNFNNDNNKVKNVQAGSDARLGGLDGWDETLIISRYVDIGNAPNQQRFACFYSSTMKIRNKERLNDPLEKKLHRHIDPNFVEKNFSGANGFRNVADLKNIAKILDTPGPNFAFRNEAKNSGPFAVNLSLMPEILEHSKRVVADKKAFANEQLKMSAESFHFGNKFLAVTTVTGALLTAPLIATGSASFVLPGMVGLFMLAGGPSTTVAAGIFNGAREGSANLLNFRATAEKQALEKATQVKLPEADAQHYSQMRELSKKEFEISLQNEKNSPGAQQLQSGLQTAKGLGLAVEIAHEMQANAEPSGEKKNYVLPEHLGICPSHMDLFTYDIYPGSKKTFKDLRPF